MGRTGLEVVIAGRDPERLAATLRRCEAQPGAAGRARVLVLDASTVVPADLTATGAFVVVDATGPFQGGDYRLARAAIAAGIHYVDLADAREFVAGFGVLDHAAKQAGVVALTGVSTTPALSNAVLDRVTAGWRAVDRVEIAISPGNRAPRGLSVVRAILSYAGRPVRVFTEGRWGVIQALTPLTGSFRWIAGLLERCGTDRGGMMVEATGVDGDGNPIAGMWSLIAEAGDGPFVPTLPALAALCALADGRLARPGASACAGVLLLEDIEAMFAPHRIRSTLRFEHGTDSLYERV